MEYDRVNSTTNKLETKDFQLPKNPERKKSDIIDLPQIPAKGQIQDLTPIDESPAILYVVSEDGVIDYFTNSFYLTEVQEVRNEKVQIMETFSEPGVFFFGEKTKVYSFSGMLIESKSSVRGSSKNLWYSNFIALYDGVLRGSQLADNRKEVILTYGNVRLYGYFLSLNTNKSANSVFGVPFSFSMLVRKVTTNGLSDDINLMNQLDEFYNSSGLLSDTEMFEVSELVTRLYDIKSLLDGGKKRLPIRTKFGYAVAKHIKKDVNLIWKTFHKQIFNV